MPWIVGNGRLLSTHPIRTAVLALRDHVLATAGLFPNQGVYAVALNRQSGDLVWRRKIEQSPQGYLLATADNQIYVPTGRTQPFAISGEDGRFLFNLPSPGGSFCMLTPEAFFSGPGNQPVVQAQPNRPNAKMLSFTGRQVVAGAGHIWTANGAKLVCHDMQAVADRGTDATEWSVDCQLDQALVVSGKKGQQSLFVAGGSQIDVFDATRGTIFDKLSLPDHSDRIKYLAVSGSNDGQFELLVATTDSGAIYAWEGVSHQAVPRRETNRWPAVASTTDRESLATAVDRRRVQKLSEHMVVTRGLALVLRDATGSLTEALLEDSQLRVVSLVTRGQRAERLRAHFHDRHLYGHRVTVWEWPDDRALPFAEGLFNVVIEAAPSNRTTRELLAMLTPQIGTLWRHGMGAPETKPVLAAAGVWRHQYGNPTNQADSRDLVVGEAAEFRLLWFGGVGPSRMPDRHLRGPAPLSAGASMVLQGDGVLIGVDPANGTERWAQPLAENAMRYVTPFDAGYVCLTEDGSSLFVAAGNEIRHFNAYSGQVVKAIPLPAEAAGLQWGYLAEAEGALFGSCMKPTAPRTARDNQTRFTYVDSDYRSVRPLVTSRHLYHLDYSGQEQWSYQSPGVIVHSAIALDHRQARLVFVEARSNECVDHPTDRITMPVLMQDAHLVCLETKRGDVVWEQPLKWPAARNVLYVQMVDDQIVLTSSESRQDSKADYLIRVLSLKDGTQNWQAQHRHIRSGLFHGEQVHHPVVLNQADGPALLVAEPYLYEMSTGKRVVPKGANEDWALKRPGHSCGTLSGTGHCLFFRAGNPTVLNLSGEDGGRFTALSPSRPGCWINMIPAGGRLLIPEASASCVCNYSLQTSMAFEPVSSSDVEAYLPLLEDVVATGQ